MLSWALNRNAEPARTFQVQDNVPIEQPDTPAPIFAVRALKSAFFGAPTPRSTDDAPPTPLPKVTKSRTVSSGETPSRPGILLTPGTATICRKRVSFEVGVKQGAAAKPGGNSGLPDACPGKFPSPWTQGKIKDGVKARPKTRLSEALERSRKKKTTDGSTEAQSSAAELEKAARQGADDGWEEVDDQAQDNDVTTDLAEPHSRSGKYWKAYFEEYHADAKAEMEKLVKYKQLAKSYAKKKDAEALDLHQKLKEEQEKLKRLEATVAEMGRQVALKAQRNGGEYDSKLLDDLAKQTALALDYKEQVDEFGRLLRDPDFETNESRRQRMASPRTHKTLMETQRELRKARTQSREMERQNRELERLREEREKLKTELKLAQQRATKLVEEKRAMTDHMAQTNLKACNLERELDKVKIDCRQKDRELKKLRHELDEIKDYAKARYTESTEVLALKNEQISQMQDEIRSLKVSDRLSARTKKLEAKLETAGENFQASKSFKTLDNMKTAEEEGCRLVQELGILRQSSIDKGLLKPATVRSKENMRETRSVHCKDKRRTSEVAKDEIIISSRSLGDRYQPESVKRKSSEIPLVLTDRVNLFESREVKNNEGRRPAAGRDEPQLFSPSLNGEDVTGQGHPRDRLMRTATQSLKPTRVDMTTTEVDMTEIDLMQSRFARLGGPNTHNSAIWTVDTSRITLPPDRQAAALARLERKRAKRAMGKAVGLKERSKENVLEA